MKATPYNYNNIIQLDNIKEFDKELYIKSCSDKIVIIINQEFYNNLSEHDKQNIDNKIDNDMSVEDMIIKDILIIKDDGFNDKEFIKLHEKYIKDNNINFKYEYYKIEG